MATVAKPLSAQSVPQKNSLHTSDAALIKNIKSRNNNIDCVHLILNLRFNGNNLENHIVGVSYCEPIPQNNERITCVRCVWRLLCVGRKMDAGLSFNKLMLKFLEMYFVRVRGDRAGAQAKLSAS